MNFEKDCRLILFFSLFFLVFHNSAFSQSTTCAYGSNGSVSCGGRATTCAYGSNGSVSCGGSASQCTYGSNGSVSCNSGWIDAD